MDWNKFLSRKFIMTQQILIALIVLPLVMSKNGVPVEVQVLSLVGILAIAVSYHIANVKDSIPGAVKDIQTNVTSSVTTAVQETIKDIKGG